MNEADARMAWAALVEPGDGDAGALIGLLGAARSLSLVDDVEALVSALGAGAVLPE